MREETTAGKLIKEDALFLAGLAGLIVGVYWPTIWEMASQWSNDANYSHGFLIPVVSAYVLYERRKELADTPALPSLAGLALAGLALALFIVGNAVGELFTMRTSLVALICAITLYLFGTGFFKKALFPLLFLFFMVPLPYIVYDAAALPLKLFVTQYSVWLLKHIGIPVIREGNILMFPELTLEVADACSGLRSLMSLFALVVAYVGVTKSSPMQKGLLIAATLPIALFTNGVRVIATGILAHRYGSWAAEGFFHEFAGLGIFVLAAAMLVLTSLALKRFVK